MDWAILLGSLGAILALAVAAKWLGLGREIHLDPNRAAQAAEEHVLGFAAEKVHLSTDCRHAIVTGVDRSVVLLKVSGARIATRHLAIMPQTREVPEGFEVDSGDRWFGRITVGTQASTLS